MAKKNKSEVTMDSAPTNFPVDTSGRPKRDIIKEAIENGGATRESLMALASVDKAGLASQLSYLNLIATGAGTGFPMTAENGVFYLGTKEEYDAKKASRSSGKVPGKAKTAEEILENARKREDNASAKFAKCKAKFEANQTSEADVCMQIAGLELKLAGMLLSKVEQGDYSSESATLVTSKAVALPETDANMI